jgi:predicted nucleic acid-binding protein
MRILLDTSVLIDLLRNRNDRGNFVAGLLQAKHSLATSVVNIAELYAGMLPAERSNTENLLSGLMCLGISGTAARLGGQLKGTWAKRGHSLTLSDTLIAAVAIEQNCALLTDNQKHFPMPELRLYPLR